MRCLSKISERNSQVFGLCQVKGLRKQGFPLSFTFLGSGFVIIVLSLKKNSAMGEDQREVHAITDKALGVNSDSRSLGCPVTVMVAEDWVLFYIQTSYRVALYLS